MKIRDLLDKLDAINEGGGQFYAKSPHDMGSTEAPMKLEEFDQKQFTHNNWVKAKNVKHLRQVLATVNYYAYVAGDNNSLWIGDPTYPDALTDADWNDLPIDPESFFSGYINKDEPSTVYMEYRNRVPKGIKVARKKDRVYFDVPEHIAKKFGIKNVMKD